MYIVQISLHDFAMFCQTLVVYHKCLLLKQIKMAEKMTQPLIFAEEDVEHGGKEQDAEHEIQNDFAYRNNVHNADIKIRMGKYKYG